MLLHCMDGKAWSPKNTVARVREQRAVNKVYGLTSAAKWSGYKKLIDLLDDLLGHDRMPVNKVNRRVRESVTGPRGLSCLILMTTARLSIGRYS